MSWNATQYQARHSYVYEHGENLVEMLAPFAHERILDLGCGSGQLTAKIADAGPHVLGLDSSPEMIAEARRNFPKLAFDVADAASFRVAEPFDAVFSNAALHWVKNAEGAAASIARALKPGGRGRTHTRPVVFPKRRRVLGDSGTPRLRGPLRRAVRPSHVRPWRGRP
jgi:trans-aconitate 2-methyltransferase